jgi:hypothetical protein
MAAKPKGGKPLPGKVGKPVLVISIHPVSKPGKGGAKPPTKAR